VPDLGPCVVCGGAATEPHHRIPKSMWPKHHLPGDPDDGDNRVPVCRSCHAIYNSSRGPGQMPYMGEDRWKRQRLALRVEWVLSQGRGYRAMLPDYAVEVWREYR
jgi:hypothetical protein